MFFFFLSFLRLLLLLLLSCYCYYKCYFYPPSPLPRLFLQTPFYITVKNVKKLIERCEDDGDDATTTTIFVCDTTRLPPRIQLCTRTCLRSSSIIIIIIVAAYFLLTTPLYGGDDDDDAYSMSQPLCSQVRRPFFKQNKTNTYPACFRIDVMCNHGI